MVHYYLQSRETSENKKVYSLAPKGVIPDRATNTKSLKTIYIPEKGHLIMGLFTQPLRELPF